MKLLYAILCNDIIVDRETSSTSFIKTFEHGTVRQLPAQVPPFFVGTLWELDPKAKAPFTVSLTLATPSGDTQELGSNEVTPTGAALHKVNFHLPGLQVKEEGRHAIQVKVRTEKKSGTLAQLPLYVLLQPAEQDRKQEAGPPKGAKPS